MAFQTLTNIGVRNVDTTIDVVSKGDGSHAADEVIVTSTLQLLGDIDASGEAVLLLPLASEAQQQPLVRYSEDDITQSSYTFDPVDRSVYDQQVADRLAALADGASKKEQKALNAAIDRAADSLSQAVVRVKPGQRHLRLFYAVAADAVGGREFEFSVIGPLPSFAIQAGGSISVLATLARGTTLVNAVGLTDPNNPGSEIAKTECDAAGRKIIGWYWQNDPLFRVRYRYA